MIRKIENRFSDRIMLNERKEKEQTDAIGNSDPGLDEAFCASE
jgi:hypothetical protein